MRASNVSPNTIVAYGGVVRQFGRWLMDSGYPTEVRAILGTRQGGSFENKRDGALIRMFFHTGARRRESAALRYAAAVDDRDVELRRGLVHVLGKGGMDTPSHWLTRASWRSRIVGWSHRD